MSDLDYELEPNDGKQTTFDIKGLVFKILNYWPLIVLSVLIALGIAYYINVRKQNIYRLESLISVENEQSPFFTSNTSIAFNWGGVSGKVGKVVTELNTRTHNELVVDSLEFYKQYLREGEYNLIDIYSNSPFEIRLNKDNPQLLGKSIELRPIDDDTFELYIDFGEAKQVACQIYDSRKVTSITLFESTLSQKYRYGQKIDLSFFNGIIEGNKNVNFIEDSKYYFKFLNFDAVVNQYKDAVRATPKSRDASSILRMQMIGNNKARIVDFLNATVEILAKTELERKNLYATNTIKFIDSSLAEVDAVLKAGTNEMSDFRKRNKVFDVTEELTLVSDDLKELDKSRELERSKLQYLNSLEQYLITQKDYTNIVAPTSVGITEANIIASVQNITVLAIERQNLEYTTQPGNVLFDDLDRKIDAEKNVLLETIAATKQTINYQLNQVNNRIAKLESELRNLPEDQQEFLKIQRKLDISIETYNVYQSKLSEAKIIKAANVSDITFIDRAKDIGGGKIGPNTSLNYIMATLLGFGLPIILIFILYLLDNNIHNSGEVEKLSRIPILGLIGVFKHANNLVVYEKPKSTIAESFRAIRSSLQFIYKQQESSDEKGKTLMVTSSISGEGKTFCSINISTVYALSGKKTILLGLDLRKPKIFGDFKLNNEKGIVNYLIGEESLENTITNTHIENLDLISSGPIPPNPSELLMSDKLKEAIEILRKEYDFIVLDTPPLGLVADALELSNYADATIYMIRFDYTKKGMLQLVNAKYRNGEVKNISFVLNFYKYKARYGYGYGYSYGYGYGSYGNAYHKNDKQTVWAKTKNLFKRK